MERVMDKIKETRIARYEDMKKITEMQKSILVEMQEQAKRDIILLKTPTSTFTLTKKGIKKSSSCGTDMIPDNYNIFLSALENLYEKSNDNYSCDRLKTAENVTEILGVIADRNKIQITGKYIPK
jgi:hypothetical protein